MIIIGGKSEISIKERLTKDGSGGIRYFEFDEESLAQYKKMVDSNEKIAVYVSDIKELIYVCNIGVQYAITNKEDAPIMQKVVETYMYDTKLIAIIYDEDEIEWAATSEIDGVVIDTDEEL